MMLHQLIRAFGLLLLLAGDAYATPYVPASGTEVLENLPARNDPAQQELKRLRAQLAINPRNVSTALQLSRRYIDLWRDGGDPRYLGYAQAVLAPWWQLPQPPVAVQVMRATLLQSTHQFPASLADLDAVLKKDPYNIQAWLTRATILQVIGDYPEAKISCEHLEVLAPLLVTQTCLSSVGSLSGHAEESYQQLNAALVSSAVADAGVRLWIETLLAEMAVRRGDQAAAQQHFEQALADGQPDNYLLAAYADFLLNRHQPAKVAALLKLRIQVDALLLRYAIASRDLNVPEAARTTEMLAQRFEAARMRGDTIHQREQARFELELKHDPVAALKVAQANWNVQKEPPDTLLLLQSAVAAHDKEAATPVLKWIHATGLEDRALEPLMAKLEAMPG